MLTLIDTTTPFNAVRTTASMPSTTSSTPLLTAVSATSSSSSSGAPTAPRSSLRCSTPAARMLLFVYYIFCCDFPHAFRNSARSSWYVDAHQVYRVQNCCNLMQFMFNTMIRMSRKDLLSLNLKSDFAICVMLCRALPAKSRALTSMRSSTRLCTTT